MASVRWIGIGCGLLLAYGCGRVSSNGDGEVSETGGGGAASGGAGRSSGGSESGGAPTNAGALSRGGAASRAGASAAGASEGGTSQAGAAQGGASHAGTSSALGGAGQGSEVQGGADAGGGAAGSEAFAGAAGDAEGGSGGHESEPESCAAIVASDGGMDALQSAIDAAEVPSTICIEAGGYRGDLQLRAGVSVRGMGVSSVICGTVHADAATQRRTTVSNLQIAGGLEATGNVRLSLVELEINTWRTAVCSPGSNPVRITQNAGGKLDLVIDRVMVNSPGFEINVTPGAGVIDDSIVLKNSRCDSSSQCYEFLRFTFDTAPAAQAAAGSRLVLDVFNNVVRNVALAGVVFDVRSALVAEDLDRSRLWFRHNTLASAGDANSAVSFSSAPKIPFVLANNVIAYVATPVHKLDASNVIAVGNVFSDEASSTSWFSDFELGDFSPSSGSPLIGAGVDTYGVATDIAGTSRDGRFDSGAYQY